jgi:hypothetical protein
MRDSIVRRAVDVVEKKLDAEAGMLSISRPSAASRICSWTTASITLHSSVVLKPPLHQRSYLTASFPE